MIQLFYNKYIKRKVKNMELEKYIKATKDIIWNAYSEIEAALMERDEELERQKKAHWQYSKEKADMEYQKAIDKFNTDTQTAVINCRTAIQKQRDGYMKEVHDYYTPDGSKIDLNDMNLIKAGFAMTEDEFVNMVIKYADNTTMLRIIEKYAVESKMIDTIRNRHMKCAAALVRAKKAGEKEEKIFDTFVNLSTMGMKHPNEHYTMYQSRLDDYEEDAILSLLKAKLYIDDETRQQISSIEAKQLQKRNDVRKGMFWGSNTIQKTPADLL